MPNNEIRMRSLLLKLRGAKRIVIFTGQSIAAESGIPSFRAASEALWPDHDPLQVASRAGFEKNPQKVWQWHQALHDLYARSAPNAGHEAIACLEMLLQPARLQVITLNIDGMHQDAGSSAVLELNGSARKIRCHRRCGFVADWSADAPPLQCPICSASTRPGVTWFGEAVDQASLGLAEEAASRCDVFIAVGSNQLTTPIADIPLLASQANACLVEIHPGRTPLTRYADLHFETSAMRFFPQLCKEISALHLRQVR